MFSSAPLADIKATLLSALIPHFLTNVLTFTSKSKYKDFMCGPSETDPFVVNGRPSALYPKLGVHLTEMDMEMKCDRCAHLNR